MSRFRTGFGIYPTFSLINHSCNPNAHQVFCNDALLLVTKKKLRANEKITISYGPTVRSNEFNERQHFLTGYNFECRCDACRAELKKSKACLYCRSPYAPVLSVCVKICFKCKKSFVPFKL